MYKYKKSLLANSGPALVKVVIYNSEAIGPGMTVSFATNGYAMLHDSASASIAGIVHDIVDKNGMSINGSLANLAGGATVASTGVVTVDSDNTTVDKIAVIVDVSKYSIYSALVTGTIGTTTNSDLIGGWIDQATTGDRVTETAHTRTVATGGHLKTWGADPDATTRMLVSINESEVFDPSTGAALTIVS